MCVISSGLKVAAARSLRRSGFMMSQTREAAAAVAGETVSTALAPAGP